jgi:16S rRNA (cytosine967-C5)-methyltransferase
MDAKTEQRENTRVVASEIVRRWMETREFPDRLMDRVSADRAFVMELVYGVVKWKRELEWVLKQCSSRLPEAPLRAYAMVGVHQILHLDHVETYAAVNETVAAVKAHFPRAQADFVNAVLRRVAREKTELQRAVAGQPLAVRTSHPDELVTRWTRALGDDVTAALCEWNNAPAAVVLRLCRRAGAMAAFLERLAGEGIRAEPHPFDRDRFCTLPRGLAPDRVPGFGEGWFVVQDPSTTMAVDLLDPKPHERILDACAAPGGKTVAMAERMQGGGTLTAMDLYEDRLDALRDTLRRMQLPEVRVVRGDMAACGARGPGVADLKDEAFDAILLDVPCMNTGVLRRRPDARWRFSLERMKTVVAQQRAILTGAAERIKVGGRIVYSTCSMEPEEDEALVAAWLRHRPRFALAQQRKLIPTQDGVDGAYAALITCRDSKS